MRSRKTLGRWLRASGVCVTAIAASMSCAGPQEEFGPQVETNGVMDVSAVSQFRDVLSPYGSWVDLAGVGWVWSPAASVVGPDFVPYSTGGQWALGDWGWEFETDWAWGWAPFHYGRWFVAPSYGWVWWPEDEWAPAWVDWRSGEGVIGWMPLAPPGLTIAAQWNFVETRDFTRPELARHVLPRARAEALVAQTRPVGERVVARTGTWSRGPAPDDIARLTGERVPRARISAPPTAHPPIHAERREQEAVRPVPREVRPEHEEARSVPTTQRPEARPALVPAEGRPTPAPDTARPAPMPEETRPTPTPETARPEHSPEEARPEHAPPGHASPPHESHGSGGTRR